MKYLKVIVSSRYGDETLYAPLENGKRYTSGELLEIGQDLVNNEFSWGMEEVDESEVPEGDRFE
jgi:hypothetical protein